MHTLWLFLGGDFGTDAVLELIFFVDDGGVIGINLWVWDVLEVRIIGDV